MAAVNIVCLTVTLLYPNSATPFSLLPIIITTASWVFSSSDHYSAYDTRGGAASRVVYLVFSVLIASGCILLGLTSSVGSDAEFADNIVVESEENKEYTNEESADIENSPTHTWENIYAGIGGEYFFEVGKDVAFFANNKFGYIKFALVAFISILSLIVTEVIATNEFYDGNKNKPARKDLPMDYIVRAAVKGN